MQLRFALLSASVLVSVSLLVQGAQAQVTSESSAAPPMLNPESSDGNGVDLVTGALSFSSPMQLAAPAASHLNLHSQANGWNFSENLRPYLHEATAGGSIGGESWVVSTNAGGKSRQFDCDYNNMVPDAFYCSPSDTDDGSLLEVTSFTYSEANNRSDPKQYTFTDRDGTAYVYSSLAIQLSTAAASGSAILNSVTYPSGEQITVNYTTTPFTSNLGYRIDNIGGGGTTSGYSGSYSSIFKLYKGTTLLNTLTQYEAYTRDSVGTGSSTVTETDDLSRVFTTNWLTSGYACSTFFLVSYTTPAGVATTIGYPSGVTDPYYGVYRVSSVTRGGATWNYTVADTSVTTTDPMSNTTVAYSTWHMGTIYTAAATVPCGSGRYAYGQVTKTRNALLKDKLYAYTGRNLTTATLPEGNGFVYGYDARSNLASVTRKRKTGSTDVPDNVVIFQAGYDTTCSNRKTCNQPNWTKDAKGYQTDYTYFTFGAVKTVTLPADAAGLRRRTYNTYTAYTTSSGSIIQRLTRSETCGLTSAQLSLTACPADINTSVTITDYGTSTTAPNTYNTFLPYQVTNRDNRASGYDSQTTTYAYDSWGHVTSVDGPLAGTVDQSFVTYDAIGRKIFEIGPIPGGTGTQKRTLVRHTYNADNQETQTAQGYASSNLTTGVDAVFTSYTRMTYDTVGRLIKSEAITTANAVP